MLSGNVVRRGVVACLLGILMVSWGAYASEVGLGGELGYTFHYLTESQATGSSKLSYRLTMDGETSDTVGYHLGLKGEAAYRPVSLTSMQLDEAYITWYLPQTDVRIGRQVINWGTADGINPTNDLNPHDVMSLTEYASGGVPVPAVQASYYLPHGVSVTGVAILDFVPGRVPTEMPAVPPTGGPTGHGDQVEWALRAEIPLGGRPIYATYFRGWQDLPVAWLDLSGGGAPEMNYAYRHLQSLGIATAGTYRDAAFWFEGAYKIPESISELEAATSIPLMSNEPYAQMVVGSDYTFSNGLYASIQAVYNQGGSLLQPYLRPGQKQQAMTYVLLRGRYTLGDRHTVEMNGIWNTYDKGSLLAPQYIYDAGGGLQVNLGAIVTMGDSQSEFVQLKPLAQGINAGVKLSF